MKLDFFVKTENREDIRYFAICNEELTGIVYGYVGGGEYNFGFIYKGKYLPYIDEKGNTLEDDEIEEFFKKLTGLDVETLLKRVEDFIYFDVAEGIYKIKDSFYDEDNIFNGNVEDISNNPSEFQKIITSKNFKITPPSFGNTYWEETPEQYHRLDYSNGAIQILDNTKEN
jgi:hypothetical protein